MLQEAGVKRLEAIIITHPHPDHMGGIFHLLPAMETAQVLDNGQPIGALPSCDLYRWYVEAVRSLANYGVLKKGDRLQWGPVKIEILWPPSPTSVNWNSNALVLCVRINGRCVLLMSDVGHGVEAQLLAQKIDWRAEGLQVGHHGAPDASSEIFLRAVAPRWAVISVNSENVRGYPSEDVLRKLRAVRAKVFLTSDNGTCTWEAGSGLKCKNNVVVHGSKLESGNLGKWNKKVRNTSGYQIIRSSETVQKHEGQISNF
jgi:competence protein ComEC